MGAPTLKGAERSFSLLCRIGMTAGRRGERDPGAVRLRRRPLQNPRKSAALKTGHYIRKRARHEGTSLWLSGIIMV